MQRAQRAGHQTGGHHNQKRARPAEKLRQIQTHTALINQRADDHCSQQPQYRADGHRPSRTLLKHRQEEKHTLQPLARHSQKSHAD